MNLYVQLTNPYSDFIEEQMEKWHVSKAEVIRMALRGWMIDLEEDDTSTSQLIEELYKTKFEATPLKDLPFI